MAVRVPRIVARVAATVPTVSEFTAASTSWEFPASTLYQRSVNPAQWVEYLVLLKEKRITTAMGRYRKMYTTQR